MRILHCWIPVKCIVWGSIRDPYRRKGSETFVGMLALCHIEGETVNVFELKGKLCLMGTECISVPLILHTTSRRLFLQNRGCCTYAAANTQEQEATISMKVHEMEADSATGKQYLGWSSFWWPIRPKCLYDWPLPLPAFMCVSCCVEHNDPWWKIQLRLWDGRGAILIRCLLLRTQQDHLKSMVEQFATPIYAVSIFRLYCIYIYLYIDIYIYICKNSLLYQCYVGMLSIPGCFIFIGCWIDSNPDTGCFLIGYCVANFFLLIGW